MHRASGTERGGGGVSKEAVAPGGKGGKNNIVRNIIEIA